MCLGAAGGKEWKVIMAKSNKNLHLTLSERQIIQRGIENGATKASIAATLGKDK